MSCICLQNWNIEQEKDREKEKSGGRPVKLKEKKIDRDFKSQRKKTTNNEDENFVAGVRK